jgi:hypothetical protein
LLVSGINRQFYTIKFTRSDLDPFTRLGFKDPDDALLGLARGLASSPLWSQMPGTELIVRHSPLSIAIAGSFDEAGEARLNTLVRQLHFALHHLRFVDYSHAIEDCRALASALVDRFGDTELKTFHFTFIPRGGAIVLGMISYLLGLERWQMEPPPSEEVPLVVLDDCSLTGLRFADFLTRSTSKKIIFAHLYSHPGLRTAMEENEPRVLACVSAHDLENCLGGSGENQPAYQELWQSRFTRSRSWIGLPEYICFAWNEPDRPFWNPVTEKVECGWNILPPEMCLKNRYTSIPVHVQPVSSGQLRTTKNTLFTVRDTGVMIGNLDSTESYALEGVAAEIWNAVVEYGDHERVIRMLSEKYNVDESTLRSDVTSFIDNLISLGVLEKIDGTT